MAAAIGRWEHSSIHPWAQRLLASPSSAQGKIIAPQEYLSLPRLETRFPNGGARTIVTFGMHSAASLPDDVYKNCKRKKWGKKWMEIRGVPTLNGKVRSTIPFVFLNPSLRH